MTTLRQQIEEIMHERCGYSWKEQEPFQLSEKSLGGVIPIILKHTKGRKYELYEEAEKNNTVKITDSGKIERLKVSSKSDKPIFVRMGTVFTGDTQSRAASVSTFIMPQKETEVPTGKQKEKRASEIEIPVKCVHASHGINQGSRMVMANASAPRGVMYSMMSGGNQSAVWSGVQKYSCNAARFSSSINVASDNFLGVKEQVRKAKGTIGDYIKKIPRLVNQVGVIIFDSKGVAGIEVFDHPDSWKAFQESVYEEYEDVLLAKQEEIVYKVDKDALRGQVMKFLKESVGLKGKLEFEDGKAKTFLLKGEKKVGEFSILDSKIIHFIIMREEKEVPKPEQNGFGNFGRSPFSIYDRGDHLINRGRNNYYDPTSPGIIYR